MTLISALEFQAMHLIAQGENNKIIATKLGMCYPTLASLLFRLYRKAGVANRTQLGVWFFKNQKLIKVVDGRTVREQVISFLQTAESEKLTYSEIAKKFYTSENYVHGIGKGINIHRYKSKVGVD